jgi:hypothetical protein
MDLTHAAHAWTSHMWHTHTCRVPPCVAKGPCVVQACSSASLFMSTHGPPLLPLPPSALTLALPLPGPPQPRVRSNPPLPCALPLFDSRHGTMPHPTMLMHLVQVFFECFSCNFSCKTRTSHATVQWHIVPSLGEQHGLPRCQVLAIFRRACMQCHHRVKHLQGCRKGVSSLSALSCESPPF